MWFSKKLRTISIDKSEYIAIVCIYIINSFANVVNKLCSVVVYLRMLL